MDSKKLTTLEIEKIYHFVKQNGVPYIDLQHELVDHIAEGIETTWLTDKSRTFNQCLYEKYDAFKFDHKKSYPVSNFKKILNKRRIALEKYWVKNIFKYVKEYFKLPLIIITLIIMSVIMILLKGGEENIIKIIAIASILLMFVLHGIFYLKYRQERKQYIVINSFVQFYYTFLFNIPYSILLTLSWLPVEHFFMHQTLGQIISSISLGLWLIVTIGAITTFPSILKRDVLNQLNIRLA